MSKLIIIRNTDKSITEVEMTDLNIKDPIEGPVVNPGYLDHTHSNLDVLSKLDEANGLLTFEGLAIAGEPGPPGEAPTYSNALPSAITVGGISSGSTFADKTMTEMFDDLLYPELFPILSGPTSTFTLTQEGLQEIGAVLSVLNFSSAFNRGSISPAYGTSGFRSGLPSQYTYTGAGLSNKSVTVLTDTNTVNNYTVLIGAQSWTGRVAFSIGEQPLSSKGNNFNTPLASGNTSIVTRTITGVYPFFGTTVNITTQTKQTLAAHNSTYFQINMIGESGSDKQTASFPTAFNSIVGIQFLNTVSGAWEWIGGSKTESLTLFTTSNVNITVNGTSVPYRKYTHNGSMIGDRQLRFYTV